MPTPRVRLATADDAAPVVDIYSPLVRDTAITFEVDAPSVGEMRQRIVGTSMRFPWLVATSGGSIAGFAYAGWHRRRAAYAWSADVSVYVTPVARRTGVARGLYTTLLGLLTAQGYANAFAGISLPNEASVGLHHACGFTLVGVYPAVGFKLGDWWDVAWWQRRLAAASHPPPPTPFSELAMDRVTAALAAGTAQIRNGPSEPPGD